MFHYRKYFFFLSIVLEATIFKIGLCLLPFEISIDAGHSMPWRGSRPGHNSRFRRRPQRQLKVYGYYQLIEARHS